VIVHSKAFSTTLLCILRFSQSDFLKVNIFQREDLCLNFTFKSTLKKYSHKKRFYTLQLLMRFALHFTMLFLRVFIFPLDFVTDSPYCFNFAFTSKKARKVMGRTSIECPLYPSSLLYQTKQSDLFLVINRFLGALFPVYNLPLMTMYETILPSKTTSLYRQENIGLVGPPPRFSPNIFTSFTNPFGKIF